MKCRIELFKESSKNDASLLIFKGRDQLDIVVELRMKNSREKNGVTFFDWVIK